MRFQQLFWLSLLSALLFILAWPEFGFAPIIFFAFIPLLFVEADLFSKNDPKSGRKVFLYSFATFLTWNAATTWWICNATFWGGIMAVLFDTFLMTFTFFFFHRTKKRTNGKYAWLILISYWLTYEFIHLNWDLSFSWLMLGNVFSKNCWMVQWYEYTGAFGGSIWVLGVNFLLFHWFSKYKFRINRESLKTFVAIDTLIFIPLLFSFFLSIPHEDPADKKFFPWVIIVQPNIDPYNEKFSGNYQQQIDNMIKLAETKLDSNVDFLIFPETAIQEGMREDELNNTYSIRELKKLAKKYPKLNIITGASTFRVYLPGEKLSPTAHKFDSEETYYEEYNTALQVNNSDTIQIYHKSKLVPFVEKTPFPSVFGFLEAYAIKMGGMSGSYGSQPDRTNFISNDEIKIAPAICYESIYGDFIRQYVKNGADFICVITNDGWWGDTQGYKQHLSYASLRAIETRRCVIRCGNTGISCFIDKMGTQTQNTNYWEQAVIKGRISFNNDETFYVKYGDYLVYPFLLLSVIFCFYGFYLRFRK